MDSRLTYHVFNSTYLWNTLVKTSPVIAMLCIYLRKISMTEKWRKFVSGSGLAVWDPIATLGRAVVAAAPRGAQVLNSLWRLSFRSKQRFHPVNTKHTIVNLYIYIYIVYIVRRSRILANLLRHSGKQFKVVLILRIVPTNTTTTPFLILLTSTNKIQKLKATVFLPRLTKILSVFRCLVLLRHYCQIETRCYQHNWLGQ